MSDKKETQMHKIEIDVTPEVETYQREEHDVKSLDDITKLRQEGMKRFKAAQTALSSRYLGDMPDSEMPSNKLLLLSGYANSITRHEVDKRRPTTLEGKKFRVREYIAPIGEDQYSDDTHLADVSSMQSNQLSGTTQNLDDSILLTSNPLAADRALLYLQRQIPGIIWSRLVIMAEHGLDYKKAANELCKEMKDMVKRLES